MYAKGNVSPHIIIVNLYLHLLIQIIIMMSGNMILAMGLIADFQCFNAVDDFFQDRVSCYGNVSNSSSPYYSHGLYCRSLKWVLCGSMQCISSLKIFKSNLHRTFSRKFFEYHMPVFVYIWGCSVYIEYDNKTGEFPMFPKII